ILLLGSAPVFAFGSSGADCNGDGVNDISCSGMGCRSIDEGAMPGTGGFCECVTGPGTSDTKTCAEWKKIAPAAFSGPDIPWLNAVPAIEAPGEAEEGGDKPGEAMEDLLPPATVEVVRGERV
ncbi:MAG: hypothetical protein AAFX50_07900, partial [Acidobacteriota bacterium]